jgi:hypothetical protein
MTEPPMILPSVTGTTNRWYGLARNGRLLALAALGCGAPMFPLPTSCGWAGGNVKNGSVRPDTGTQRVAGTWIIAAFAIVIVVACAGAFFGTARTGTF